MDNFICFFISSLIIFALLKSIYKNNEIVKIKADDNIEYIVRDLSNSKEAANKLSAINQKLQNLINSLDEKQNEDVIRLKDKYNPRTLSETLEGADFTSYSVNKGEKIFLCIRTSKDPMIFEEDNTIIFVAIHELAHVMTTEIGHTKKFWDNMKFLLEKAEDLDIYKPIDYNKNNEDYCGMEITTTPYDFKK